MGEHLFEHHVAVTFQKVRRGLVFLPFRMLSPIVLARLSQCQAAE